MAVTITVVRGIYLPAAVPSGSKKEGDMRRARNVLALALVLLPALVLSWSNEAQTREVEEPATNTVSCPTNPCFGASGNDTILGTDDHEQIHALQGGDRLSSFDGSDIIAGDANLQEDRFLSPGPGSSTLTDGDDRVDAGPGNDGPVRGYGGSDVLLAVRVTVVSIPGSFHKG